MRLYHFSEDPAIKTFAPRPVAVPSPRPAGHDWLNGPLVWAIEQAWQALYLFPRDCPRILLRRRPGSSAADVEAYWGAGDWSMIAHMEWAWYDRFRAAALYRYELPAQAFEALNDAGMWVSRAEVRPVRVDVIDDLAAALRAEDVDLRLMERLTPLRSVWETSLHASGVRLRNATGWE